MRKIDEFEVRIILKLR